MNAAVPPDIWSAVVEDYEAVSAVHASHEHMLRELRSSGHACLLDLGCGPGKHCALAASAMGFECLGLDASEPMLAKAVLRRVSQVHFVCGDMCRLPLADASLDVAVAFNNSLGVIAGWQHRRQAVREAARVARRSVVFEFIAARLSHEEVVAHFETPQGRRPSYVSARMAEAWFEPCLRDLQRGWRWRFQFSREAKYGEVFHWAIAQRC